MLAVMKKILLSTVTILALAACEDPYNREGIGFTGIDGEPRTLADVPGAVAFLPPATNVPAELAALPTIAVTTDQVEAEKVARVAIDNGGRSDTDSVVLTGQDTNLFLSTVSVNGALYGVLRTESNSTRVDNRIGSGFGRNAEQFTGCLPAGEVFRKGSSSSSSGFAVLLDCS
ncbi:hypothetical protein AVO44_09550 [Ruegeria profundi]|uniref:Lipoprotein n=2 Tax=Ruegeria profundi TaxID=1685378 RepID=A0A0X3TWL2_9RHOB|nr:hypothetical protein AVO44_09550 [Ruegeria profundi]